jgi:hypothetical protein
MLTAGEQVQRIQYININNVINNVPSCASVHVCMLASGTGAGSTAPLLVWGVVMDATCAAAARALLVRGLDAMCIRAAGLPCDGCALLLPFMELGRLVLEAE